MIECCAANIATSARSIATRLATEPDPGVSIVTGTITPATKAAR